MISVIVPTIAGREHWLERCEAAYVATLNDYDGDFEIMVLPDHKSCGIAWNLGLLHAVGDYIHLTADDIEPLPGWWQPAIESADRGELPAARILNSDGTLQSCGTDHREHPEGEEAFVARVPFATREQFDLIGPMMDNQYMGDYWFSHRGRQVGLRSVVRREYSFIHHYAQEGRIDTLQADVLAYKQKGGE